MKRQTEEKLKQAVEIYMEDWLHDFPAEKELPATVSAKFEMQMHKLIQHQIKPYYVLINTTMKRVAAVLLIVTLSFSAMMSVEGIRTPVVSFFVQMHERYSELHLNKNDEGVSEEKTSIEEEYAPAYIPEGFGLTVKNKGDNYFDSEYLNEKNQWIFFEQFAYEDPSFTINTEGVTYEEILIQGTEGIYYENNGIQSVWWFYQGYTFSITTDLGREELLEIAESVKENK